MTDKVGPSIRRPPGDIVTAVLITVVVVLATAATWSARAGEGELALDLAAAGAALAVLALLVAAVRRPPELDIRVAAGELRVRFHGWDVLWSLRREVRIPLEQVRSVRVHRPRSLWSGWWHRRLGTVVPRTIKAGWFNGPHGRELWDVRAGADVIDVQLAPPSPITRLVLQVPDPTALARSVTAAREPIDRTDMSWLACSGTADVPIARLSANDLTNLATDRGSVPMQIGAVLLLDEDSAPDADELASVIEQRLARVPRLGQRLRRAPLGCGRPYWEDAPLGATGLVTLATAPAEEAGLVDTAVEEILRPLPRDRPLWRAVVYADPAGRARGLVVVMHHVLADGIGGLAVLVELVDSDIDDTREPTGAPRPTPSRRQLAHDARNQRRSALHSAPSTLRGLTAGVRELGGIPRQGAGRSSLLQPTSPRRRVEIVEVDLVAITTAAHAQGATVNDLLLVAVSGALRRLLAARDEQLDEVLISVPVSARPATSSADLGNQVGVLPVAMPLVEDPAVRLVAVRDQRARLGASAPRASSGTVLSVLFRGLAAVGIFQWFVRHQRLVHTFVTNLRGPTEPLALAGSRIRRLVPIATVPGNVTVSFDVLSYAGRLLVSVVYDPAHVPDHVLLRDALACELTELSGPE
jgi:diacylglycerol O-acyltransferase